MGITSARVCASVRNSGTSGEVMVQPPSGLGVEVKGKAETEVGADLLRWLAGSGHSFSRRYG